MSQGYRAHYATGSKAFTETLRDKFGWRGRSFFTYFNAYANAPENALDVLLYDRMVKQQARALAHTYRRSRA